MNRRFRLAVAALFFRLLRRKTLDGNPFELCSGKCRVLVIRQHNQMGDMLLATPCLRALRERLPHDWITLVASDENEAVVRANPHVNEVLVYSKKTFRKRPFALLRLLLALRRARFDVCVVLSTVSFSITSGLICLFSGARYRLSYSGESFGMGFVDKAFHAAVPMAAGGVHQTRIGLGVLEHFGITTENLSPVMVPGADDEVFAAGFMSREALRGEIVVGVHAGAGKMKNRWPAVRFAHVADALSARGARVLVMAGPSDADVLDKMLRELKSEPVVLKGQSIGRVAAIMKRLSLLLCNDTGVLHVAASVGCPTLALFGPTDPSQWAPLAGCVTALRAERGKLENLEEKTVLDAALGMISPERRVHST